jgi:hypothetical protein
MINISIHPLTIHLSNFSSICLSIHQPAYVLSGVENNLKKGAKPNFFYRPEDQKNALHV